MADPQTPFTQSKKAIFFREDQHQAFFVDVMVYVAGFDVTNWITGSVRITIVARDGWNTVSFTLQNANDNFVITPENIKGKWRTDSGLSPIYSEKAKKDIYDYKNGHADNRIDIDSPWSALSKNDIHQLKQTGGGLTKGMTAEKVEPSILAAVGARMWPLDPYRVIFHKHDPIRVFYHHPLTPEDGWLPGFTGYLDTYSFDDNYENGESTISISGYDIRALAQKMRLAQNPISSSGNAFVVNVEQRLEAKIFMSFNSNKLLKDSIAPGGKYTTFLAEKNFEDVIRTLTVGDPIRKVGGIGSMQWGETITYLGDPNNKSDAVPLLENWHTLSLLGYVRTRDGGSETVDNTYDAIITNLKKYISLFQDRVTNPLDQVSLKYDYAEFLRLFDLVATSTGVSARDNPDPLVPEIYLAKDKLTGDVQGILTDFGNLIVKEKADFFTTWEKAFLEMRAKDKKARAEQAAKSDAKVAAAILAAPDNSVYGESELKTYYQGIERTFLPWFKSKAEEVLKYMVDTLEGYEGSAKKVRRVYAYTERDARYICEQTRWDGAFAPDKGYVCFLKPSGESSSPSAEATAAVPTRQPKTTREDAAILTTALLDFNDLDIRLRNLPSQSSATTPVVSTVTGRSGTIPNTGYRDGADTLDLRRSMNQVLLGLVNASVPYSSTPLSEETRNEVSGLIVSAGAGKTLVGGGLGEDPDTRKYDALSNAANAIDLVRQRLEKEADLNAPAMSDSRKKQLAQLYLPNGRVSSDPGMRTLKDEKASKHEGYDIGAAEGSDIVSPPELGDGVVELVRIDTPASDYTSQGKDPDAQSYSGYGAYMVVRYDRTQTRVTYGHLDVRELGKKGDITRYSASTTAKEGDRIAAGTVIARVGRVSDMKARRAHIEGAHLHLQATKTSGASGHLVDPLALAGGMVARVNALAPRTAANETKKLKSDDAFNIGSLIARDALDVLNNSEIEWANRYDLINEFCTKLDYQWYVSPMGDIFFEFPMADFFPADFGSWKDAFTFDYHLKSGSYNDESIEPPTVLKVQGHLSDNSQASANADGITNGLLSMGFIIAPTLVRRLGVNMAQEVYPQMVGKNAQQSAVRSALKWGMVDFQRKLSGMVTFDNGVEYRPFLMPNRPVLTVPRQRIGLITSIDHSMDIDSTCGTHFSTTYTRHLDASLNGWTCLFGTPSMPINYRDLLFGKGDLDDTSTKHSGMIAKAAPDAEKGGKDEAWTPPMAAKPGTPASPDAPVWDPTSSLPKT